MRNDEGTLELTIKLLQQLAARLVENPSEEDATPKRRRVCILGEDDDLEEDTTPKRRWARILDEGDWGDNPSPAEREAFQAACRPNEEAVREILTKMMDKELNGVIVIGRDEYGSVTTSCVGLSPQLVLELLEDAIGMKLDDDNSPTREYEVVNDKKIMLLPKILEKAINRRFKVISYRE